MLCRDNGLLSIESVESAENLSALLSFLVGAEENLGDEYEQGEGGQVVISSWELIMKSPRFARMPADGTTSGNDR